VAASRAGGDVTFVARVGDDSFGERALEGFKTDRLDVRHVVKDPDAPSGVAFILVDDRGENSIAVAPGANANLSSADVAVAEEAIVSADTLVMQLETPLDTVKSAAVLARRRGVRVILNPAPAQQFDDDILGNVSVLTPNETEAERLTGISVTDGQGAEAAARSLRGRGVEIVIITLGSRGAYVLASDLSEIVPGLMWSRLTPPRQGMCSTARLRLHSPRVSSSETRFDSPMPPLPCR
jgi:ribokinase